MMNKNVAFKRLKCPTQPIQRFNAVKNMDQLMRKNNVVNNSYLKNYAALELRSNVVSNLVGLKKAAVYKKNSKIFRKLREISHVANYTLLIFKKRNVVKLTKIEILVALEQI